jgi:hypothetical protein
MDYQGYRRPLQGGAGNGGLVIANDRQTKEAAESRWTITNNDFN